MTSEFSINPTLASGQNTITLPETGLTLVGVSCLGVPYIAIQTSPGKNSYIPMGNATGVGGLAYKDPMFKVKYTFKDLQFFVTVPNAPTSPCIFYFGTPSADAMALEDLEGVAQTLSLTQGTTAGVMSGSVTFSFPSGKIKVKGAYSLVSANYSIANFQVKTGKNLYVLNSNKIDNEVIHPLSIEGSQSFLVNISGYIAASATNNYWLVLYYKVM